MNYLKIKYGYIVVNQSGKHDFNFIKKKSEEINIKLIMIEDIYNNVKIKEEFVLNDIDYNDINCWRYSYFLERKLIKKLKHLKKEHLNMKCYQALDQYHHEINSGIFFEKNIINKINLLCESYIKNPKLTARCGNEILGNEFKDDVDILDNDLFKSTFYKCENNPLQISSYIEHKARLAILTKVVDYICLKKNGIQMDIEEQPKLKFGDQILITNYDLLPDNIKEVIEKISKNEFIHKYPVFWQWFSWFFGGFILLDYEDEEFNILSKKSGLPIKEIPNAFKIYELLFPKEGGWWFISQRSNIKLLKLFPPAFRGIGVLYRKKIYSKSGKIEDIEVTGEMTQRDLSLWNNLGYKILNENI